MYVGGSSEVVSFIEKYKKTGHLVDYYSQGHLRSLYPADWKVEVDAILTRWSTEVGTEVLGHLLVLYVGVEESSIREDLACIYDPFKRYFSATKELHGPDILFINLHTKEVLCVGLGRKNRVFCHELHRYLALNLAAADGAAMVVRNVNSAKCSPQFRALDVGRVVDRAIQHLEALGEAYLEHSRLPGTSDFEVKLDKVSGLFYFECERQRDDKAVEFGLTSDQVETLRETYLQLESAIDIQLDALKKICPRMEAWDAHTGDW